MCKMGRTKHINTDAVMSTTSQINYLKCYLIKKCRFFLKKNMCKVEDGAFFQFYVA